MQIQTLEPVNIIYTNELRDVLGRDARHGLGADDRAEPSAVRQANGEAEAAAGAEDLHQYHRQGNILFHTVLMIMIK